MKAIHSSLACMAGLVAGTLLAVSSASAADKANADAFPVFDNTIKVSGYAPFISGNKGAVQRGTQNAIGGAGGIEEFRYSKELSDNSTLKMDGHALGGAEDYLLQFKVTKNEVGSFEAGYKRFRTFYDGAGGFFPLNNAWIPIYSRALFVDRGKFFINATVELPNAPVFSFRYSNSTRSGRKDSTIWGDSDYTGIPIWSLSSMNPVSANRKIIPAYMDLNERHQMWEASVKHKVANSTLTAAVIGTSTDNLNTRSIYRYPGELKPFPAIPTTPATLVPYFKANNPNQGFDQQGTNGDSLALTGKVETVVNDKVTIFVSGLYRKEDNDISASRLITAWVPTAAGLKTAIGAWTTGGRPPYSYNSTGHIKQKVYTGVFGAEFRPLADLYLSAAYRMEDLRVSGYNNAVYVNTLVNTTTGAFTDQPLSAPNTIKIKEKPKTPELEARYTGVKTVALFANWSYRSSPSDERTSYVGVTPSGSVILPGPGGASLNITEHHSNLKVGANWTPNLVFNARAELFTKDHENNFTGYGASLGDYYILDYDISGAKLSATIKPRPEVSFTTGYVQQVGKSKTIGNAYPQTDAGDSHRYQISETINWNPNKAIYVQGNISYVYDQIITSYPVVNGLAKNVLHNSDNNYVTGSVLTGFVVDKKTDLQVQGTYYNADNYNPALAGSTLPVGADATESSVTVGVKHKLSDRMILDAKVGYLKSESATTGGFSDYDGPLAYVAVEYKL